MLWDVATERQSFRLEQKGIIQHYLTLRDIIGHYEIKYDITQRYVLLRSGPLTVTITDRKVDFNVMQCYTTLRSVI